MARKYGFNAVAEDTLRSLELAVANHEADLDDQVSSELKSRVEKGVEREDFRMRLMKDLEPHIRQSAGQLHDYLDLSSVILKQLNVFIARQFPNFNIPDDLDSVPDELQSIYWAARLMEEKISGFTFYLQPETILRTSESFRLHGAITKYRKIYERNCKAKKLNIKLTNGSYEHVRGNPEALMVIPHALIDNAIKYAPIGSTIEIGLTEHPGALALKVGSYGPKIEKNEVEMIFEPFFRAKGAGATLEEGMGFGLAFAQVVAEKYGQRITVTQIDKPGFKDRYWTEFECSFNKS
jgi:signal transduction histidine kinase